MFSIRNRSIVTSVILRTSYVRGFSMNKILNDLKNIFLKSVGAVEPKTLIKNNVTVKHNKLFVCNKEYDVNHNCYVVGFGKAVFGMATELESILGSHLVRGIVSVPVGIFDSSNSQQRASSGKSYKYIQNENYPRESSNSSLRNKKYSYPNEGITYERNDEILEEIVKRELMERRIKYLEGAENNLADAAAERTAKDIVQLVQNLNEKDLLIVLISGGGSALLPLPVTSVTLQEKSELIKLLSRQGADILELNCVRRRLSQLKGGGLACQAYPATVVALVLSDIIGDPLDCIASGPTTPARDNPDAAAQIIEKYGLCKQLPDSVHHVFATKIEEDTKLNVPKSSDGSFSHVTNFMIGNNGRAAAAAATEAKRLGYQVYVVSVAVSGDVCKISAMYARLAGETAKFMKGVSSKEDISNCLREYKDILSISDDRINEIFSSEYNPGVGVCFIAGGEPTVVVRGGGAGGRNQQLALQFSIDVNNALQSADECVKCMNISLLSCGTDGIDGPTNAAGAVGSNTLWKLAHKEHINPLIYLHDNNCYNFYTKFQNGQYLIRTGHTGTNVMDIHVLMINDKN